MKHMDGHADCLGRITEEIERLEVSNKKFFEAAKLAVEVLAKAVTSGVVNKVKAVEAGRALRAAIDESEDK